MGCRFAIGVLLPVRSIGGSRNPRPHTQTQSQSQSQSQLSVREDWWPRVVLLAANKVAVSCGLKLGAWGRVGWLADRSMAGPAALRCSALRLNGPIPPMPIHVHVHWIVRSHDP